MCGLLTWKFEDVVDIKNKIGLIFNTIQADIDVTKYVSEEYEDCYVVKVKNITFKLYYAQGKNGKYIIDTHCDL